MRCTKKNISQRILGKDCFVNNNSYETNLNNNDIIIGTSGCGKTRGYVLPNILQANESLIVADPKGNLYKNTTPFLTAKGYKVYNMDFTNILESDGFNPLDYVSYNKKTRKYSAQDIKTLSACIIPIENSKDPFWELAARTYLESFIAYVLECLPKEKHSMAGVVYLFTEMNSPYFINLFDELSTMNPTSFAVKQYNMYKNNMKAEKMHESIRAVLAEKISVFTLQNMNENRNQLNKIDFSSLGKQKTAIFIKISDTDRSMDMLANLFYTQALHTLCNIADQECLDGKLDVPVRFILDDFATNVYIPNFDKIISTIRSRNISVSIILQSISQLESLYGNANAMTILNNADHLLYLGGQDVQTARYISIKANKSINTILDMPLNNAWLFARGEKPSQISKYDLYSHENYCELTESFATSKRTDKGIDFL